MRQSITSEVIGALENRRWRTKPDQVPVVGVAHNSSGQPARAGTATPCASAFLAEMALISRSRIGRCLIEVKASADACPTMEQREGE
jgi:hypothetical protein